MGGKTDSSRAILSAFIRHFFQSIGFYLSNTEIVDSRHVSGRLEAPASWGREKCVVGRAGSGG